MTREEAERAAATFEFPPFRVRSIIVDLAEDGAESVDTWALEITGPNYTCVTDSTQFWLAYYAAWQRTQAGGSGVPALGQNDGDEGSER